MFVLQALRVAAIAPYVVTRYVAQRSRMHSVVVGFHVRASCYVPRELRVSTGASLPCVHVRYHPYATVKKPGNGDALILFCTSPHTWVRLHACVFT